MAQYTSFHIQFWTDPRDGAKRWEVRHAQTGQVMDMGDDAFMLTLWAEPGEAPVRGSLKHVTSGETIQFQSSERLLEFLAAHLALPKDLTDDGDPIVKWLGQINPKP